MTEIRNDLIECPVCGGQVLRRAGTAQVQVGSRTVPVQGDFSTCAICGEMFFGPGEMDDVMRQASSVVRREEDLLQPEEIRAIRESLDMSQAEFERLLGVGQKTVVRWEKGTVFQNGATDSLLRLLRDVPACVGYLRARAGLAAWTFFSPPTTVNVDLAPWNFVATAVQPPTTQFLFESTLLSVPELVPARLTEPAFSEAA